MASRLKRKTGAFTSEEGRSSLWRFTKRVVLWLNLLLLVPLGLALLAPYVPPSTSFIPTFLGLFTPWLLLIPVVWLLFWLLLDIKWAFANLAVVLLCSPAIQLLVQLHHAGPQVTQQMRVLSLNINALDYKYANITRLTDVIARERPDVLCLQEFCNEGLKGKPDFLACIRAAGHFQFMAFDELTPIAFGLVIFSHYPIIAHHKITDIGSYNTNGIIYADLKLYGEVLRVYNVHLQSYNFKQAQRTLLDTLSVNAHRLQAAGLGLGRLRQVWAEQETQLELLTASRRRAPGNVLICGDLNNPPYGFIYHELGKGLTDSFMAEGQGFGITHGGGFSAFRIDYIFAGPTLEILDHRILETPFTDHKGVAARVCFKFHLPKEKNKAQTQPTQKH